MQEFVEDLEKYCFYLNAKFDFFENLLFSNLVQKPSSAELYKIKSKLKKQEIERLYNHFHISAISENINKQREYVVELWKNWRSFFDTKMQDKTIIIEIYDSGNEVIVYIYEK
jgi:hypothetical protein